MIILIQKFSVVNLLRANQVWKTAVGLFKNKPCLAVMKTEYVMVTMIKKTLIVGQL